MEKLLNKNIVTSVFLLYAILILSSCGNKSKINITKPPYEFGTSIDEIIENEGEPTASYDSENQYRYGKTNGKIFGYDAGFGYIDYMTNDNGELIQIHAIYSDNIPEGIDIDIEGMYSSMTEILDEECDIIKSGFRWLTKDGLVEIIVKPDSKWWGNLSFYYKPTNLNEDGTFK